MGVYPDELRDPLGQRGQVPAWIAQLGRDRLVSHLARARCAENTSEGSGNDLVPRTPLTCWRPVVARRSSLSGD